MAWSDLLRLPPEPLIQQNRSTPWGRERPWPASGCVSGGICRCLAVHSHYEWTTKHLQPCSQRPVLGTGLCASTGTRGFTSTISLYSSHRDENVVANLLSRSTPPPAVDANPDTSDLDLIQLLHSPLEATVSLQEL